jgi:hypothetical protein
MGKKPRLVRHVAAAFIFALLTGCMPSHVQPVTVAPPVFPPQTVMQSGAYKAFLDANTAAIKACSKTNNCAEALFNLSFLYCYPQSPYYNPTKALQYISDLIAGAPKSPWAAQALVWRGLIVKAMKEKNRRRYMIQQERLKSREADLQNKAAMAKDWQVDRQLLQDEIKSKDEIIQQLTRQIKGSRKIDLEMEKKEKGLLH